MPAGLPVVEMVRAALRDSRCSVTGAVLTGSERMDGGVGRREIRVGKTHLVARLQVLLEQRLIALPETAEARQLAQELQDFEIRKTLFTHLELLVVIPGAVQKVGVTFRHVPYKGGAVCPASSSSSPSPVPGGIRGTSG